MRLSVAVAAVLMLLHSAFVAYGPRPREPRFQSGDQLNRHVIEKFSHDASHAKVVLVGSSMTARLGSAVESDCAYNLALGGEAASTGLTVLADLNASPALVLVEINVPERRPNERLVEQSTRVLARLLPALATENMPVNMLFSFMSQYKPAPTGQAVDDFVLAKALAVQRTVYAHEIPAPQLVTNMEMLKRQVRRLEDMGTRVVFFELPVHPDLEDMPRARQIRGAFAAAFPARRLIGSADLASKVHIRTIDGVHLAPDEAASVSETLRQSYAGACARPAGVRPVEARVARNASYRG